MEAILPLVLILAAFYLLILGPRRAQARRAADLKTLRPGTEIITTAGVIGTVTHVDEDEVRLEIAPGVVIRLLKGAVGKVLDPTDPSDPKDPNAPQEAAAAAEAPGAATGPADAAEPADTADTTDEGNKGSGPASSASH